MGELKAPYSSTCQAAFSTSSHQLGKTAANGVLVLVQRENTVHADTGQGKAIFVAPSWSRGLGVCVYNIRLTDEVNAGRNVRASVGDDAGVQLYARVHLEAHGECWTPATCTWGGGATCVGVHVWELRC